MTTKKSSHGADWRCRACNALLGVCHGDGVHVRYKDLSILVRGQAEIACRRCLLRNTVETTSAAA